MKKLFILTLIFAVAFMILYFMEKSNLPVSYKICDLGYQNCHVVAKFDNREDCEATKKDWNMLCTQTNNGNSVCKENTDQISSAFCE